MKKVYYFLFAAMGLASCSNEDVIEVSDNVDNNAVEELNPNRRTYAEVLEIAQNSITMLQDSAAITRGEVADRSLNLANGVKAVCKPATRANGTSNDTVLYVFNFNDDKGFALVSANRATEGLLAVIEEGNYDPSVEASNPFIEQCMQNLKDYATNMVETETANSEVVTRANYGEHRTNSSKSSFAPKINVEWNQAKNSVTGYDCPNKIAGSGAVAMMQVMSSFEFPKSITTSYANSAYPITPNWNWFNTKFTNSAKLSVNKNDYYQAEFSKLFREMGYRAKASYGSNATTTQIANVRSAMSKMGFEVGGLTSYDPASHPNASLIGNYLSRGWLVIMEGQDSKTKKSHTFVIDGGTYEDIDEQVYFNTWTTVAHRDTYYHHINWGEGGKYNGYYIGSSFCPGDVRNLTSTGAGTPTINTSNNFNTNMKYFTVFHK